MKNMADIEDVLMKELRQWFVAQSRDIFADFYLYYLPTTAEHDGGFLFASEDPENPEWQLGWSQPVNKGATVEQNFNRFREVLRHLPILEL